MTIKELADKLQLTVLTENTDVTKEVTGGFCSDMLSYVMGKSEEGQAWITIQGHNNIIAVAALKELSCIVLADGIKADKETIESAQNQDVAILSSPEKTFDLSGKLYELVK